MHYLRPAMPLRVLVVLTVCDNWVAKDFFYAFVVIVLRPDTVQRQVGPRGAGVATGCRCRRRVPETGKDEAAEGARHAKRCE